MSREPEIEILEIVGLDEADASTEAGPESPQPDRFLEHVHLRRAGHRDGVRAVLRELLPALDDLEQCVRQQPDAQTLDQGVRLALRALLNAFRHYELERIEGDGMPFDPRYHEASVVTETDRVPPGTVLETLRAGYLLAGDLVRPAMVRVSKEMTTA